MRQLDATTITDAQNLAAINAKLGQENDPTYLAYAVMYVLSQAEHQLS